MSEIVEIRGAGGRVRLEVLEYTLPDTTNRNESNRLTCKCNVEVRDFACNLNVSLRTHDFVRFRAELNAALKALSGDVIVDTLESRLRLEVSITSGGQIDVFGYAQSNMARPSRTVLTFSFESDQSFLAQTDRELERILQHFPVR
jgi:hypothetical protein